MSDQIDKPTNNKKYIYWAVGILVVLIGFALYQRFKGSGFQHVGDAEITAYDEQTIDALLSQDDSLAYGLPEDGSPNFFTVSQGTYTDDQINEMVAAIGDRHSALLAEAAEKLESDAELVAYAIASAFSVSTVSGEVTEEGIDLYVAAINKWIDIFVPVSASIAEGVAAVAAATIAGVDSASECVETTFVKSVDEASYQTDEDYYKVQVSNNSKAAWFGLSKKKSSTETRTSIRTITRNDFRTVEYIPHCTNWQLDPTEFAGVMEAGRLALEMYYSMLSNVMQMVPNIEKFVKR